MFTIVGLPSDGRNNMVFLFALAKGSNREAHHMLTWLEMTEVLHESEDKWLNMVT